MLFGTWSKIRTSIIFLVNLKFLNFSIPIEELQNKNIASCSWFFSSNSLVRNQSILNLAQQKGRSGLPVAGLTEKAVPCSPMIGLQVNSAAKFLLLYRVTVSLKATVPSIDPDPKPPGSGLRVSSLVLTCNATGTTSAYTRMWFTWFWLIVYDMFLKTRRTTLRITSWRLLAF